MYAFGVILLELLIGKRPVEKMSPSLFQSIVTWVTILFNVNVNVNITYFIK